MQASGQPDHLSAPVAAAGGGNGNNNAVTRPRAGPARKNRTDTVSVVSHLVTRGRYRPNEPVDYEDYPGRGSEGVDYPADDPHDDDYLPEAGRRRHPAAVIAAVVLVAAGIGTAVILNSDSSGSQATVRPVGPAGRGPTVTALPDPTTSTATARPPSESLPPKPRETNTTPTAIRPTPTPSVAAVPPSLNPRTVRYAVTGTKQLFDLVTIIYTDAQGMPRTDFNVALPWTRTVVLNPGVQLKSVIATSLSGRLGCAITNAEGQVIVASANNTFIATCAR